MFDLMRQTRHGSILCSNDAKSCYERIFHSVLSLSLQRLGVPAAPIISMLTTIQHMKHTIKTAYGVLSQFSASTPDLPPLQGLIQGHSSAPTGCGMTCTPIINAPRKAGFGFQLPTAISQQSHPIACTAFVDDTDLWREYQTLPPSHPALTVFNYSTKQCEPLTLLPLTHGRRSLGVYLRPDGQEHSAVNALATQQIPGVGRLTSSPTSASYHQLA